MKDSRRYLEQVVQHTNELSDLLDMNDEQKEAFRNLIKSMLKFITNEDLVVENKCRYKYKIELIDTEDFKK